MHLIFVPSTTRRGAQVQLGPAELGLLATAGVLLAILIGLVSYQISALMDNRAPLRAPFFISQLQQALTDERSALAQARRDAELHLNAMARQMGLMQAQLSRLEALGGRLVEVAGLDGREFDFSARPAIGGPAARIGAKPVSGGDFALALDTFSRELDRKAESFFALETAIESRQIRNALMPKGWPTEGGWLSSGYGVRADPFHGAMAMHEGVDIAARLNSSVRALGAGVVSFTGDRDGYGLTVEIDHGNGFVTRYAHLFTTRVRQGERVQRGREIARVGDTGRSTGPHLHLEVLRDGRAVDPSPYLVARRRG